ncbi:helix-turn-helix domain-containing protein [Thiococcus pfennigii]|uniref:helix-turn-helix domain-containing protein n=1 Tax=Thiococcus pfennigii TaxID=1057 RepID=UPI001908AC8B|nr:helix-turn-helix transcriptional regulator [Thiococcus pfennigii]MBK1732775.1 hypothetical protein [Thiococcus pfennigii]
MKAIRRVVAGNIHALRRQRGLTQIQLAEAAGIAQTYVGQIERDGRNVTLDVLEAIAVALGVAASELVTPPAGAAAPAPAGSREAA